MRPKFYHAWAKATSQDGTPHYITVVGKLEQGKKSELIAENADVPYGKNKISKGILTYDYKKFNRKLTLGLSICHPHDRFDENVGVDIAKKRIEKGDTIGVLETSNLTMLNEDAIMAEIIVKLNYISIHLEKYLKK